MQPEQSRGHGDAASHQETGHRSGASSAASSGMSGMHGMRGSYGRFAAMIATSTVVMLALMYSMVYSAEHLEWSQTRFWMALYMGATMALIMLAFMRGMYHDRRKNLLIFAGSAVVFLGGLWIARRQATIGDVAWMKGMIPHHSIAITTSERAHLTDPRVRELADSIISSQTREIREMKLLIEDIQRNGSRGKSALPAIPAVVTPGMEPRIREALQ